MVLRVTVMVFLRKGKELHESSQLASTSTMKQRIYHHSSVDEAFRQHHNHAKWFQYGSHMYPCAAQWRTASIAVRWLQASTEECMSLSLASVRVCNTFQYRV
jgi:hypothetical protein